MQYQLQVTDMAYGRVPDSAWRVESTHRSTRALARAYTRANRWRHPRPGAWTGHVRIVNKRGDVMYIEDHGYARYWQSTPPRVWIDKPGGGDWLEGVKDIGALDY